MSCFSGSISLPFAVQGLYLAVMNHAEVGWRSDFASAMKLPWEKEQLRVGSKRDIVGVQRRSAHEEPDRKSLVVRVVLDDM